MNIQESFLSELQQEAQSTRKMLERVPYDNPDWAPHEKSMNLGSLAKHVAEISSWVNETVEKSELDFATANYEQPVINSNADLLAFFDDTLAKAVVSLKNTTSAHLLNENWTLRTGDQIYFTMPKHHVIRTFVLNHIVHHRAQLGTYLRQLDIPVPGMYGPTADEK